MIVVVWKKEQTAELQTFEHEVMWPWWFLIQLSEPEPEPERLTKIRTLLVDSWRMRCESRLTTKFMNPLGESSTVGKMSYGRGRGEIVSPMVYCRGWAWISQMLYWGGCCGKFFSGILLLFNKPYVVFPVLGSDQPNGLFPDSRWVRIVSSMVCFRGLSGIVIPIDYYLSWAGMVWLVVYWPSQVFIFWSVDYWVLVIVTTNININIFFLITNIFPTLCILNFHPRLPIKLSKHFWKENWSLQVKSLV